MRRLFLLLCALVPCACRPATEATPGARTVSRVVFHKSSGPVVPPWSEQYVISTSGIQFRRTSEPGSRINVGTWDLLSSAGVPELLARLAVLDCSRIKEILPDDTPEGGGTTSYLVEYGDGTRCSVYYRDGITYSGAEELVGAIDGLIASLSLPEGASGLFVSP